MGILSSQGSAIEQTAGSLQATFCLSASAMNDKTLNHQAAIVGGALQQSAQGLGAAAGARKELAQQLDGHVQNVPSAAQGGGSLGLASMATSAGAGIALTAMNPVVGAAFIVADTVHAAVRVFSGGGHAGITHAAIDGGKSEFGSLISKSGKSQGGYTDVMGGTWDSDGFAMEASSSLAVPKSAQPSGGAMNDPQMALRAQQTIDKLGEDEVRGQLAHASYAEKRLQQQGDTAIRFAQNTFGIVGSDGKADMNVGDPNAPSVNDPNWKMTVNAPMFGTPKFG